MLEIGNIKIPFSRMGVLIRPTSAYQLGKGARNIKPIITDSMIGRTGTLAKGTLMFPISSIYTTFNIIIQFSSIALNALILGLPGVRLHR